MFLTKIKRSPFYQIVYELNGKRNTISTRTTDIKEAQKIFASFIPEEKLIINAVDENKSTLLSDFKDEYITYSQHSKSSSYIKRSIEPAFKFFIEFIGNKPLKEISLKEIDNFIISKYKHSPSSAALYYRTLKAAFNKAIAWEYIELNPFTKIKAPKMAKSLPVFISEEELNSILNKTEAQFLKEIFTVAFFTGMRIGEILNMKWNWIDTTQNIIIIKNSSTFKSKSKKERIIPIHNKVNEILSRQKQNSAFIFYRYVGIKLNEDFISKQFKKSVRAAKLNDNIHFHTLRHSFASNLVQKGANLYVVKELLGHEDIKTTQVYSHLTQSSLITAVHLL